MAKWASFRRRPSGYILIPPFRVRVGCSDGHCFKIKQRCLQSFLYHQFSLSYLLNNVAPLLPNGSFWPNEHFRFSSAKGGCIWKILYTTVPNVSDCICNLFRSCVPHVRSGTTNRLTSNATPSRLRTRIRADAAEM